MISTLLFFSITLGLIELNGFSIRTFCLVAIALICAYKLKATYFYYVNLFFVLIFLLFYSYLYSIGVVDFSNIFLLHTRNLLVFIALCGFLYRNSIDFKVLLSLISYFIVFCAFVNILIIMFFDKPWVVISLYSGTDEDSFGHLYNRLILPFGTPNQLGFVTSLLLIYNIYMKNKLTSLFLMIPLLGSASNSSLIPLGMILCYLLIEKVLTIRFTKIKKSFLVLFPCFVFVLFLVSPLLFEADFPGGLGGRSSENMACLLYTSDAADE